MTSSDRRDEPANRDMLRSSLAMLAFGLAILALLVAIERPQWFHLRPASGTAAAMFNAATPADGDHAGRATDPATQAN